MQLQGLDAGGPALRRASSCAPLPPSPVPYLHSPDLPLLLHSPAPQYAHHACVQRWLNERPEKGSALCEVCGKPLKGNWQLWRAADDPLQLQLAALWRLLVHGSGAADARGAGEEWAAPAPGPGPGLERRRVSGSTAAGLGLLLAASGVLLLRQLLRVVPDTGGALLLLCLCCWTAGWRLHSGGALQPDGAWELPRTHIVRPRRCRCKPCRRVTGAWAGGCGGGGTSHRGPLPPGAAAVAGGPPAGDR